MYWGFHRSNSHSFAIRLAGGAALRPTDARECVRYTTQETPADAAPTLLGMLSCRLCGLRYSRAKYRAASPSQPLGAERPSHGDGFQLRGIAARSPASGTEIGLALAEIGQG